MKRRLQIKLEGTQPSSGSYRVERTAAASREGSQKDRHRRALLQTGRPGTAGSAFAMPAADCRSSHPQDPHPHHRDSAPTGGGLRGSHVTRLPQHPPRATRCLPPPLREQVRREAEGHRRRGTAPAPIPGNRLCALLRHPRAGAPSLPPSPSPPAPTGRAPPGRWLPADPALSTPRRAARHRPGPAAQRRRGTGRCRPAPRRYRHRDRKSVV